MLHKVYCICMDDMPERVSLELKNTHPEISRMQHSVRHALVTFNKSVMDLCPLFKAWMKSQGASNEELELVNYYDWCAETNRSSYQDHWTAYYAMLWQTGKMEQLRITFIL